MRRIRRPSHATVVAYVALFVALTGGTTAVALSGSNTVQSDDLGPGAQVKAADVAANAINGSKLADNQVSTLDVRNDTLSGGGLVAGDLRPDSVGQSEVASDSVGATELSNASVSPEKLSAVGSATANTDPKAAAPFLIKAHVDATDVSSGSPVDVNIYTATRDFLIVDGWSICQAPASNASWQLRDSSTNITNPPFNACNGLGVVARVNQYIDDAARQIATGESLAARLSTSSLIPVDFGFDIYVLALPVSL